MSRFRKFIATSTCGIALLAATAANAQADATVKLAGEKFKPGKVSISQGAKLKLKWKSGKHDVKFSSSADVENVGVKSSGTVTRKFKKTGTFQMVCTIHGGALGQIGGMTAKITVK